MVIGLESGFERFKKTNPHTSLAEYEKVRKEFSNRKAIRPPQGRLLPDGTFVPVEGISPGEMNVMIGEFTKENSNNQ